MMVIRCVFVCITALLVAGLANADEPQITTRGEYSLGYRIVSVSGNEWRFGQYNNPDTGPFDSWAEFHFERPRSTGEPVWWDLEGHAFSPTDFEASAMWTGEWPLSQLKAHYTSYEFHPETLGINLDTFAFDRAYTSAAARRRSAGLDGVLYWRGRTPIEVAYENTTYAGTGAIRGLLYPATPDFNTRDFKLVREGKLGPSVSYGSVLYERKFSDGTALQPDARTRVGEFHVGVPMGDSASLNAHYARGRVKQSGFPRLDFSKGGVTLDAAWDSGLGLQAFVNRTSTDNDVTVSAYTRRVTNSGVKVSYSGINRVNLRAGAEFRSFVEELSASDTSSEKPDRRIYWSSLVARPSKKFRVRASYRTSDATGLSDGRYASIPQRRDRGEAELRFAPSSGTSLTLTGAREKRRNAHEDIDYDVRTYGATLWAHLAGDVDFFGHYTEYNWGSDAALLDGWISDATVWGAYFQVSMKGGSYASLGYESARSAGATVTKDQSISLGVGWNAGPHSRFSVAYCHQLFDDSILDQSSFRANVVSANGVFEF
jgi:hypothetical protein